MILPLKLFYFKRKIFNPITVAPSFHSNRLYHGECQEIYEAIGTFISLADVEWKQDNAEKAMFYSTASANYATIYETVCRE